MTHLTLARIGMAVGLALALFPVADAFSAPGIAPWNRSCQRFYTQWQKRPNHKAFAVANSTSGQACGGTWGAPSRKAAEDGARKWCKRSAMDGASCRVTKSQ